MSKRKAFNFYFSYYDIAKELSDKDRLAFYDAIIQRQFYGIETELSGLAKFAYISQKHSIDSQVNGWESKMKEPLNQSITEGIKGGSVGGIKGGSGQEKEKEKEKEKGEGKDTPSAFSFYNELLKLGAEKQLVSDWLLVRKKKKLTNTETALKGFLKQVDKSGNSLNDVLTKCIEKSWGGFEADWYKKEKRSEEKIRMF